MFKMVKYPITKNFYNIFSFFVKIIVDVIFINSLTLNVFTNIKSKINLVSVVPFGNINVVL